ncbi:hypothetical protein NL676_012262 [Syzygium grande]|nr:hypothetical protein NL676_012262 [Syzygium grande]
MEVTFGHLHSKDNLLMVFIGDCWVFHGHPGMHQFLVPLAYVLHVDIEYLSQARGLCEENSINNHLVNRDGLGDRPGERRQGTYPSVPCFLTTNSPLMGRGALGHGESMPVAIPINELGFEPQYFAFLCSRLFGHNFALKDHLAILDEFLHKTMVK